MQFQPLASGPIPRGIQNSSRKSVSFESPRLRTDRLFLSCIDCVVDLGIDHRGLEETLASILAYFFSGPLRGFGDVTDLIHASAKCPPDVGFLLVAIAAGLHSHGLRPKGAHCACYAQVSYRLFIQKAPLTSFGTQQNRARRYLAKFAHFFRRLKPASRSLSDIDRDHYGIDVVVTYLTGKVDPVGKFAIGDFRKVKRRDDPVVERLAALFTEWKTAYEAMMEVWKVMQTDEVDFELLIDSIPFQFVGFLIEGVKAFSEIEG